MTGVKLVIALTIWMRNPFGCMVAGYMSEGASRFFGNVAVQVFNIYGQNEKMSEVQRRRKSGLLGLQGKRAG